MAISNKTWRQGKFVPAGAEPGLTKTFAWRDIEQEKAVQSIAKDRFDFPNSRNPTLKTFTNRPARQVGVRIDPDGKEMAFPDIVALEDPSNEVSMIGEVETHRSLRDTPEHDLIEKWRTFTFLGETILFVPLMQADDVKAMLKRHKLKIGGLRGWRYIIGQDLIDVSDVRT
jgi:hypothetical protein